jgi:UDP-N-acetyl-D-mannosaminuronic acid dehydrogenase
MSQGRSAGIAGHRAGQDFLLAYSPERVIPGQILKELVENARVIGGINRASAEAGKELYTSFVKGEILLTDATTAELVKLMENTYRDVNIAIANEFCRLADRFGVDIWEAVGLANRHPRVKILSPGIGVGGHCIHVDPWFLVEAAPDTTPLIHAARQVNDSQPSFVVELVRRAVCNLKGKRIAALGLSYKPDVDDLRESPAVEVCRLLAGSGAKVTAYEPFCPAARFETFQTSPTLNAAIAKAQILLLLVRHTRFVQLNPQAVAKKTSAPVVFDLVNGWDEQAWKAAGFRFVRLEEKAFDSLSLHQRLL